MAAVVGLDDSRTIDIIVCRNCADQIVMLLEQIQDTGA